MNRAAWTGLFIVCFVCPASSQKESPPQSYEDDEAYRVYEAIIPHEESYSFAVGTVKIQSETSSGGSTHGCLSEDAARKFKPAATDFANVNKKSWLLQSKFHLNKPYQLLTQVKIQQYFIARGPKGWSEFYEQRRFITLSAVGFNKTKTLAVVFAESSCGGLCSSFSFHLLEKTRAMWNEVNGVTCMGAS
jgi:hypothetical protein